MQRQDLIQVQQIEAAANQFPWSLKNFNDSLDAGHLGWIYCDKQEQIAGYAIMQMVLDEAHLLNICVTPAYQGRGHGQQILEHVTEHAHNRQASIMVLEVRESNHRARRLYEKQGFNEMSVRRGYYPAVQGREDAILMGLDLAMLSIFGDL